MPRGQPNQIEYQGRQMSLRDFAEAVGLSRNTVQNRWNLGIRDVQKLAKPADKRFSKAQFGTDHKCVNSLLAGWKLGTEMERAMTTASAASAASTPLPRSALATASGSTNYGI